MTIEYGPFAPPSRGDRSLLRLWLGGVGLVAGLGAIALPAALIVTYMVSFTLTATPDSGFNIFTIGALVSVMCAVGGAVTASVLLCFPVTRLLGVGYLIGAGIGVICCVIVIAIIEAIPLP